MFSHLRTCFILSCRKAQPCNTIPISSPSHGQTLLPLKVLRLSFHPFLFWTASLSFPNYRYSYSPTFLFWTASLSFPNYRSSIESDAVVRGRTSGRGPDQRQASETSHRDKPHHAVNSPDRKLTVRRGRSLVTWSPGSGNE